MAKYRGSDRERILYEGAKKEGKLLWYTSLVPNKHIAKVFEAKYPGVTVDVYRAAGNTLATRLLEERRAKRYLADAIESTPPQLMLLRDAQALQPFMSPHLANYPEVAAFLTQLGIDSISVNPESVARTREVVFQAEQLGELRKVV